ncbi:hypothetical protein BC936DRAFT_143855, partial [Jimgerdemannia flammicorona]
KKKKKKKKNSAAGSSIADGPSLVENTCILRYTSLHRLNPLFLPLPFIHLFLTSGFHQTINSHPHEGASTFFPFVLTCMHSISHHLPSQTLISLLSIPHHGRTRFWLLGSVNGKGFQNSVQVHFAVLWAWTLGKFIPYHHHSRPTLASSRLSGNSPSGKHSSSPRTSAPRSATAASTRSCT